VGVTGVTDAPEPRLLHRSSRRSETPPVALPFDAESGGTYTLIIVVDAVLRALDEGTVVLVDALDLSLHPMITTELLRVVDDRDANPLCAQMVTTLTDPAPVSNVLPFGPELAGTETRTVLKDASGRSTLAETRTAPSAAEPDQ
jgi:uncharacterized protein